MSQISENKIKSKNSEQNSKLKEVKSKVFADFRPPPKLIRHQSINGSSKKISSDKRSLPSRYVNYPKFYGKYIKKFREIDENLISQVFWSGLF